MRYHPEREKPEPDPLELLELPELLELELPKLLGPLEPEPIDDELERLLMRLLRSSAALTLRIFATADSADEMALRALLMAVAASELACWY